MLSIVTPEDLVPLLARIAELEARPTGGGSGWHIPFSDFNPCDDGSQSVTAAWDAWIAALKLHGRPGGASRGTFRFDTPPAVIDKCVRLDGLACSNSGPSLLKNFGAPTFETALMAFAPGSDGWSVQGFFIKSLVAGGSHIRAWSDNTPGGSQTSFRMADLTLTANDHVGPEHHIYIDGSGRSSSSLSKGARANAMRNVMVFGSQAASVVLRSVAGLWWQGGAIVPAASTTAYAGSLLITGTSAVPSSGVVISIQTCAQVIMENVASADLTFDGIGAIGGISIENIANVNGVTVRGKGTGARNGAWSGSIWVS